MANNRMYLKCTVCGEKIFLAKTYGEWYIPDRTTERINNKLDEHIECSLDFDGEIFELVYENSEVEN